jgi:hypothetical protein
VKVPVVVPTRLKIVKVAALLLALVHARLIALEPAAPCVAVSPVTADGVVIAIVADADGVPATFEAFKATTWK